MMRLWWCEYDDANIMMRVWWCQYQANMIMPIWWCAYDDAHIRARTLMIFCQCHPATTSENIWVPGPKSWCPDIYKHKHVQDFLKCQPVTESQKSRCPAENLSASAPGHLLIWSPAIWCAYDANTMMFIRWGEYDYANMMMRIWWCEYDDANMMMRIWCEVSALQHVYFSLMHPLSLLPWTPSFYSLPLLHCYHIKWCAK